MGAEFGGKMLAAVAFRGMGELEIADPEDHYRKCVALMNDHLSRLGPNKGLQSYFDAAGRTISFSWRTGTSDVTVARTRVGLFSRPKRTQRNCG